MIRLALALTLVALPAAAFTARNNMQVQPTGDVSFHVPWSGDSAPTAFWCAAGDYVLHRLGAAPDTVIYRTSPVPRRSGQGVDFSLSAQASVGETGLAVWGTHNGGLTAAFAANFCERADWDWNLD